MRRSSENATIDCIAMNVTNRPTPGFSQSRKFFVQKTHVEPHLPFRKEIEFDKEMLRENSTFTTWTWHEVTVLNEWLTKLSKKRILIDIRNTLTEIIIRKQYDKHPF